MPKVQRIFEQDGEVCVSLGKIEGEGNIVFLTEEERQKMVVRAVWDAIDKAAELVRTWGQDDECIQPMFGPMNKAILDLKYKL